MPVLLWLEPFGIVLGLAEPEERQNDWPPYLKASTTWHRGLGWNVETGLDPQTKAMTL